MNLKNDQIARWLNLVLNITKNSLLLALGAKFAQTFLAKRTLPNILVNTQNTKINGEENNTIPIHNTKKKLLSVKKFFIKLIKKLSITGEEKDGLMTHFALLDFAIAEKMSKIAPHRGLTKKSFWLFMLIVLKEWKLTILFRLKV